MKAIIHINEIGKWGMAIANSRNLKKAEPDTEIEIYANADAVENYFGLSKKHCETMKSLAESGIKLFACRNTMNARGLNEDDLPNFVKPVDSVIRELVQRQSEGFAYIKP